MVKATWNGAVLAESDKTVVVEGNHYFPRSAIRPEFFKPSDTTSICPWKGTANHSIVVGGAENRDAAWYYAEPKAAAAEIKDRIAFWKGVEIS
ncbi:hypothetical protein FG93_01474 [Bosea sp. LC85]|uniref:DUF427 domain-containing protein n=1 Tax=Bosea sp. LC85 TaxID=1502851 RepID=UPI0004E42FAC|nr:DUF427 domain-containing protein [Bosea sp. LC85]KFC73785.1 hypothetical protein FG93_01474 [Bosea sp. LC85]